MPDLTGPVLTPSGTGRTLSATVLIELVAADQVASRLAALGYAVADPTTSAPTGAVSTTTTLRDNSGGRADPLLEAIVGDLGLASPPIVAGEAGYTPRVVLELGQDAYGVVNTTLPPVSANVPSSAGEVRNFGKSVPVIPPTATPVPRRPITSTAPITSTVPITSTRASRRSARIRPSPLPLRPRP